mmetsp:Transcript_20335/g.34687  ORF Transcript_20335/g.34687 Transcript_20335/m.34687 type:complete len:80 (+) Transcript_20335:138-377(+)
MIISNLYVYIAFLWPRLTMFVVALNSLDVSEATHATADATHSQHFLPAKTLPLPDPFQDGSHWWLTCSKQCYDTTFQVG